MSLLFPLYLGGLLAIAAPIVFHMIRRTPSGRVPFSSLMFLKSSPPRLVRRKRLEQLALLCLRALVLALLAFAFARPFLRSESQVDAAESAGPVAILLDTSASMRRPGSWDGAKEAAAELIAEAGPATRVRLFTFDGRLLERPTTDLEGLAPTWGRTDLGGALAELADRLHARHTEEQETSTIVLISDLQEGSDLARLETYDWPEGVRLEVRRVQATGDNAALHPAPGTDRVRIANAAGSATERFRLRWAAGDSAPEGPGNEDQTVHCPPGETRVVRVPERPSEDFDRLVLEGDGAPFDNVLYARVVDERPVEVLSFPGTPTTFGGDEQDLDFFLARVFDGELGSELPLDPVDNPLAVLALGGDGAVPDVDTLHAYVQDGGVLLAVLTDTKAETLPALLGVPRLEVIDGEAPTGFTLLGEIDFAHPLFAPFADPRYSDFTKIHFWRHRHVTLPPEGDLAVIARFDDGAPFLIERRVGAGRILVMTAGWEVGDSDLARSTKFAPLLHGMARLGGDLDLSAQVFHVGDRVPLGMGDAFTETDHPGHYEVERDGRTYSFTVHLDPAESRTDPLELDPLALLGVPVVAEVTPETELARTERKRQEKRLEIERRQKLWRWLIATAVCGLLVETAWAGRLARKAQVTPDASSGEAS